MQNTDIHWEERYAGKHPGYSGCRRLDLAASLIISPPILFLDEPTTGLDPRGRLAMWEVIRGLAEEGTTALLTTQYLEEANQLAHQIVVIDQGRVIAQGSADELTLAPQSDLGAALQTLHSYNSGEILLDRERRHLTVPVTNGAGLITAIVRDLDGAQIALADLALRRPTLDDVFFSLTGCKIREAESSDLAPLHRRKR
ncbi:MAG TPA: hypothetical protein VGF67_21860 [Ktedonobacteraceae bacterium]